MDTCFTFIFTLKISVNFQTARGNQYFYLSKVSNLNLKMKSVIFMSHTGINAFLNIKPWVCTIYRCHFLLDVSIYRYVNEESEAERLACRLLAIQIFILD